MDDVTYFSNAKIGSILIAPHAAFSGIATIFGGLRLYTTRTITKTAWTIDEYVSIIALVANYIMLIAECVGVSHGLGSNMIKIQNDFSGGITSFLKSIVAIECAYGIACPLSKAAVLAMYYRIFSAATPLRYSTWVIASMLGGWGISVVLVSTAIRSMAFGTRLYQANASTRPSFISGSRFPTSSFDFLTVALPVREVWKLQMGRDKKWALTTIFLLGGTVVLASFARLVLFLIYQPGSGPNGNNISQTVLFPHTASAIETCLALIGACLPPCAPLLKHMLHTVTNTVSHDIGSGKPDDRNNLSTRITVGSLGTNPKRRRDNEIQGSFERLDDNGSLQGSTDGLYVIEHDRRYSQTHNKIGSRHQIRVQREVQVERTEDDGFHGNQGKGIPLRNL